MAKFLINKGETPNGTISFRHEGKDTQYCEAGKVVEIDWMPTAGWGLQEAHYTDGGGNVVSIDLETRKFTMPASNIEIGGTFKRFVIGDWTEGKKDDINNVDFMLFAKGPNGEPVAITLDQLVSALVDTSLDAESPNPVANAAIVAALTLKQNLLESGTNIKTINGVSVLGSGDLVISASEAGLAALGFPLFDATQDYEAGEVVIYADELWQFDADHAAGAWTGTDATQTDLFTIINTAFAAFGSDITVLQAAVGDINDMLALKANKNGYYQQMTVGASENLVGRGSVEASYNFRTSGGTADIGTGAATVKQVDGKSIVWNQLANARESGTAVGLTFTNNGDGSISISGEAESTTNLTISTNVALIVGHKYFVGIGIAIGSSEYFTIAGVSQGNGKSSGIYTALISVNSGLSFHLVSGTSYSYTFYPMTIDLTLMFGAGNEPSTAAEFEALYPLDYYAYNAGEIVSNKALGIETVGRNLLDPDTGKALLPGTYNGTADTTAGTNCYQIIGNYTSIADADGNAITPNADGYFMVDTMQEITVTGGDADTCVAMTWSGWKNGESDAYDHDITYFVDSTHDLSTVTGKLNGQGSSVTVFPDGLRSAGSVHDYATETEGHVLVGSQSVTGAIGDTVTLTGCDTTATEFTAAAEIGTLSAGVLTLTAAATAVEVLFPLATPQVYTLDEPLNMQYSVDDFGTERKLPADTASAVTAPIAYEVQYAMNAVDQLRRLPENYISKESFENFCTELSSKLGAALNATITITATYDSTDQEYDYAITITPNE